MMSVTVQTQAWHSFSRIAGHIPTVFPTRQSSFGFCYILLSGFVLHIFFHHRLSVSVGSISYLLGPEISLEHCHPIRDTPGVMFYPLLPAFDSTYAQIPLSRPTNSGLLIGMET
ncbi:unnamed protein product [Protopolystoma xenopodis]|uniref:Uncharacterized protein n=1 Tax=Protopolystoma xenopodis TaxID=117903 RepID=A0A3S5FCF0_9PLAT|nr:unnamed protein product [Protopolystoma xenopodis]